MNDQGRAIISRAPDTVDDDAAKEELKRQVNESRESISQTMSEIGNVMLDQVEAVKDTLDWREHVKKNPVAWSLGALGASCLVGYAVSSSIKHAGNGTQAVTNHGHRPQLQQENAIPDLSATELSGTRPQSLTPAQADGPSLIKRLTDTDAFGRVREEAGAMGNHLLTEAAGAARQILIPAVIAKLTTWLEKVVPSTEKSPSRPTAVKVAPV